MKVQEFSIKGTIFYIEEVGYVLYLFAEFAKVETCIKAFIYDDVVEFINDLEILLKKDHFSHINKKSNDAYVDDYNYAMHNLEISGVEIGIILNSDFIVYPHCLPQKDKEAWCKVIMNSFRISVQRNSFKF